MNALHRLLDDPEHRYRPGAPSATAAVIDGQVAAVCTCTVCGTRGLEYRPFTRAHPDGSRSYRAFTVCPTCDDVQEL